LYYTASGIITPVGGRPVQRTANNLRHLWAQYSLDDKELP